MKKLYGLFGFAGFIFIVSAAGGADTAPIGVSVAFMLMGIAMMVTSELLVGLHNRRARQRRMNTRQVISKKCVQHNKKIVSAVPVNAVNYKCVVRPEPELC